MSKRILTGIRANGDIHLGNYLGAIKPMLDISKNLDSSDQFFMFVPDLHSITTEVDYSKLFQTTIDNIKIYLAAGLETNSKNIFLYRQSMIPAHSEMAWLLSCFSYFGELSRMTQFKDKSEGKSNVSVGLFAYPIMMAADILLYSADYIPVGDDQRQHIELTRDLAIRINNKFDSKIFTPPQPWDKQLDFVDQQEGIRIRSLSNPSKKMSKSVMDPKGTILLKDNPEEAAKK
ncbi:tryptophan--tRNA ligase [Candidatus Gracilibacteria bacterium]|nr:tryptophan--tRNA ligase [Candidatus Gracilibacteria bacterium]